MDWFAEHLREEDDVPSKAVRGRFASATFDCINTPLEALLVTSFHSFFAKFSGRVVSVQLSFCWDLRRRSFCADRVKICRFI